ncbi:MAG: DUF3310 domain-containing protein [Mycobacterium sp.]
MSELVWKHVGMPNPQRYVASVDGSELYEMVNNGTPLSPEWRAKILGLDPLTPSVLYTGPYFNEARLSIARHWNGTRSNVIPLKKLGTTGAEGDPVNHPSHYTSHPSGVECITVTEHMGFNLGNAVKYIWRADLKDNAIQDLEKAAFYVNREIERRRKAVGA